MSSQAPELLLASHLKTLKLPTFLREHDRLARQCASEGVDHIRYLARLAELELIDLGYRLLPKAWGKGYASEAAGHTLTFGFRQLNLPVISACAHIENIASIHILEKIGMEYTGEGIVDECPVKNFVKSNPYT